MSSHCSYRIAILAALACASLPAAAAPPAGHPSVPEAGAALRLPDSGFEFRGRVMEAIPSNNYVYLRVSIEADEIWLAAPRFEITAGDRVEFPRGRLMQNFHSRKLDRTFPRILFVSGARRSLEPL